MLILNRRPGEAVLIDDGIRIVVLSCDRQGVRIGIDAPTDINIQREELRTRAEAQQQAGEPAPASEV